MSWTPQQPPSWLEELFNMTTVKWKIFTAVHNLYDTLFHHQIVLSAIILLVAFQVYLRAGVTGAGIFLLLTGAVLYTFLPPEVHTLATVIMILGFTSIIYSIIKKKVR